MSDVKISIRNNGPLLVSGAVQLEDQEGNVFDLAGKDSFALCRCGATKGAPFCDGSHKSCGFDSSISAGS